MAALCNRADHYIFILWFLLSSSFIWSPYVIGQTIIFLPVIMVALCNRADNYIFALLFLSFLSIFFFSSPNLSGRIGWMSTVLVGCLPLDVFASWQRYCTACSSGRQPNFAALNRGRHLCSAGRPSRWALAHTSCGPSANLECRSERCCTRLAANAGPKKSPKIAIWAPSHNFVGLYLRN